MSEPLMSVAGQLVGIPAEKYSGTNGVTVDQNSKTIGLDETVLWEGTPSTGNITLSEAATNFKFIRVFGKWHYNSQEDSGRGLEVTDEQLVPTSAVTFTLSGIGLDSLASTNAVYMTAVDYRIDGSTLIRRAGIRMRPNATNPSNTDTIEAYKVIGVNRISGGNA